MPKQNRNERLQPIHSQTLYPLSVFGQYAGLSTAAIRTARRGGLRVLRMGRRAYVLGSDFIEYALKAQTTNVGQEQPVTTE